MCKFELVLFDLDGTLTDPAIGITNSVMYALQKKGYPVPNRNELLFFIGPPLVNSFCDYLKIEKDEGQKLVEAYREYFSSKGLFENKVIDGAQNLLKSLKESGIKIALATSKPKIFADKILKHFNIMEYFDITVGSELDGRLTDKGEVIAEVLKGFPHIHKEKIAMVGDRSYDVLGANKNGITPVGVLCGYGDKNELETAGAKYIFHTLKELENWIYE